MSCRRIRVGVWGLVHDRSSRIHPLGPHHRRLPIDHRAFRAARPHGRQAARSKRIGPAGQGSRRRTQLSWGTR